MANEIKLADVGEEESLRVRLRRLKRHPAFRAWKMPFDLVKDSLTGSWRLATHRARHLPTTVIVGAQKAGTTQLYAYMVKHPRCYGAAEKEVDYFSKHPKRPVAWYRSRFPWQRRVWRRQGHVTAFFLATSSLGSANTRDDLRQITASLQVRAAGMLRQEHALRPALTKP